MTKSRLLVAAIVILMPVIIVRANIVLPYVIGDAMVLQRSGSVPIWGTADPEEVVTVRFAGQTKKATADKDGKWRINLDHLSASPSSASMTISGKNTIELKNILVGEVWLVAGQSNMQRLLRETANGEAAIAAADHPLIRLFNVDRQVAFNRNSHRLQLIGGPNARA